MKNRTQKPKKEHAENVGNIEHVINSQHAENLENNENQYKQKSVRFEDTILPVKNMTVHEQARYVTEKLGA